MILGIKRKGRWNQLRVDYFLLFAFIVSLILCSLIVIDLVNANEPQYNPWTGKLDWVVGIGNINKTGYNITGNYLFAFNWTNVSITESQITDLTHTTDTNASTECSSDEMLLGNTTCFSLSSLILDVNGTNIDVLGVNASFLNSSNWKNVSITESQISNLVHTINGTSIDVIGVNASYLNSTDWTNASITESQISDLEHTVNGTNINVLDINATQVQVNDTINFYNGNIFWRYRNNLLETGLGGELPATPYRLSGFSDILLASTDIVIESDFKGVEFGNAKAYRIQGDGAKLDIISNDSTTTLNFSGFKDYQFSNTSDSYNLKDLVSGGGNLSWNQSHADTLYEPKATSGSTTFKFKDGNFMIKMT